MAKVIDIRDKLGRDAPVEPAGRESDRGIFHLRLCGPDLRWVGLVGGILAAALGKEGYQSTFEDFEMPAGFPPVFNLRAGRQVGVGTASGQVPGLVVAGTCVSNAALRGCDGRTVLLKQPAEDSPAQMERLGFPGLQMPLPINDPEPLRMAVAGAGAAARLLGVIGWPTLELALRGELTLASSAAVDNYLETASEAYNRIAPWTGLVLTKEPDTP